MTTTRTDPLAGTLTVDPGRMLIRSVITTGRPDRRGDVVVPLGLQNVEEFLINPVVLWAHERRRVPPIGVCEWIDVQPHRVVAQTRFAQDVRFAEDVFRLYEQGILRGWSIGFLPRRATPISGGGTRFELWDLLEYSAVPIPENPGALTIALEKGLVKDATLREWLDQVPAHAARCAPIMGVTGAHSPRRQAHAVPTARCSSTMDAVDVLADLIAPGPAAGDRSSTPPPHAGLAELIAPGPAVFERAATMPPLIQPCLLPCCMPAVAHDPAVTLRRFQAECPTFGG